MKQPQIEMVRVEDLTPYENNPRRIPEYAVETVAQSIEQFGWQVPIVIDNDNIIVAGHTRTMAAQALGIDEIPAIRAGDLTDEQIRKYRLVDNKTAELTGWDLDKLSQETLDLSTIPGFSEDELEALKALDIDLELDSGPKKESAPELPAVDTSLIQITFHVPRNIAAIAKEECERVIERLVTT